MAEAQLILFSALSAVLQVFVVSQGAAELIFNQDGIGFSGQIEAHPLQGFVRMLERSAWPDGFVKSQRAFAGGVFDGSFIWMVPHSTGALIKVSKFSGAMTLYNYWPGTLVPPIGAFIGGVFDGQSIWLVPCNCVVVVRVAHDDGSMSIYNDWPGEQPSGAAFAGGVFDGVAVWFVPRVYTKLISLKTTNGVMSAHNNWPSKIVMRTNAFFGAVFDGSKLWLVPELLRNTVAVDVQSGAMYAYAQQTSVAFNCRGGVFDGRWIWMIPYNSNYILKVRADNAFMEKCDEWPSGFVVHSQNFVGGAFDGQSIWLIPFFVDSVIRVDKDTGTMEAINSWPSGVLSTSAFAGGVFDGESIWMIPYDAKSIVVLSGNLSTYCQDGFSFSGASKLSTLHNISAISYSAWPSDFTLGDSAFFGCVFDGQHLWMVPHDASAVVKVDRDAGFMEAPEWPVGYIKGLGAFNGGVFDGSSVWLVPRNADRIIVFRSNMTARSINSWPTGFAKNVLAFVGGAFDGHSVWLAPFHADRIISVDTQSHIMMGFTGWPEEYHSVPSGAFCGCVFDGAGIWLVPNYAQFTVRLTVQNGSMTKHDTGNWGAFSGGTFDGTSIWFSPFSSDHVIAISSVDFQLKSYGEWPTGFTKATRSFGGAVFDGHSVWLLPANSEFVVKVDVHNGAMTGYCSWPKGFDIAAQPAFAGGIYDGESIWLVPYAASCLVRLSGNVSAAVKATSSTSQSSSNSVTTLDSKTISVSRSFSRSPSLDAAIPRSVTISKTPAIRGTVTPSLTVPKLSDLDNSFTSTLYPRNALSSTQTQLSGTIAEEAIPTNAADASRPSANPAAVVLSVVIPSEAADVVAIAGPVSTVASGLVASPTAATQYSRVAAVLRSVLCVLQQDEEGPSWVEHPLQFPLGSGPRPRYAGACLSEVLLLLVFHGAQWVLWKTVRIDSSAKCAAHCAKIVGVAAALLSAYFLPNIASVSSTIILGSGSRGIELVVAILGMCFWVVLLAWPLWATLHLSSYVKWKTVNEHGKVEVLYECYSESTVFLLCFAKYFDDGRDPDSLWCRLLFFEEIVSTSLTAFLSGIRPSSDSCIYILICILTISAVHLLYSAIVRPFNRRLATAFSIASATVVTGICVLGIFVVYDASKMSWLAYPLLLQNSIFFLQAVAEGVWAYVTASKREVMRRQAEAADAPLLMGASDSDSNEPCDTTGVEMEQHAMQRIANPLQKQSQLE